MLKIKNLTKKYGDTVILEDINYEFPQKGLICLMGASGGGKTTLLNLLAGFDTQYEGNIIVGKISISNMSTEDLCCYRKDNIGFIFQNYHLLRGYTSLENILIACELNENSLEENIEKANEILDRLGILDKANQKIEDLSGGQKQRVAIARAIINDAQIIFADEPTGALDRATSIEIMELLKQISEERLVVVITHDQKICDFADEVIHIKDKKIVSDSETICDLEEEKPLIVNKNIKNSTLGMAIKNFKVHLKRYLGVALAISIGMLAFLFSLSFDNVISKAIEDFQYKNTAFNNGYIKGVDDGQILEYLNNNDKIENVYYQYKLNNVKLTFENKIEIMEEKIPTARATEGLSYGVMPRIGMNEIAITPSLAKKFTEDIKALIGKEIELEVNGVKKNLKIIGIYNAGYDDFLLSSDIEREIYIDNKEEQNYSISYDVKEFSDIVAVSNDLKMKGINTKDAATEVNAFQKTFSSLNRLFFILSILILGIGLFICIILLIKLQNMRYHEIGLLSALGFDKNRIKTMILTENTFISILATVVNFILLMIGIIISKIVNFLFVFTGIQMIACILATFIVILFISVLTSHQLISTEPAEALRK